MAPCSRRAVLTIFQHVWTVGMVWSVSRPVGAQDLGQFSAGGPPPCATDAKPTPPAKAVNFKAGSPERTSLVEPGMAGQRVILSGSVSGVTCGPIKRAVLDFWQADAAGRYDEAGYRLRGRQFSDANGNYHLETIIPGAVGAHAPRVYVTVQPPGRAAAFTTQIFFSGQPLNVKDPDVQKASIATVTAGAPAAKAAFNIVLNL